MTHSCCLERILGNRCCRLTACRKSKLLRVPRESCSMAFFLNPSISRALSTADGCGGTKLTAYSLAVWQQGSANNLSRGSLNQLRRTKFSDELVVDPPMQATASSNAGVSP